MWSVFARLKLPLTAILARSKKVASSRALLAKGYFLLLYDVSLSSLFSAPHHEAPGSAAKQLVPITLVSAY